MTTGIYKITNLENGKIYVGQSIHIEQRWKEHCQESSNSLIAQAIKKYGKHNFSFQILEECNEKELNQKEYEYIVKFDSLIPKGYNVLLTAEERGQNFSKYSPDILSMIIKDLKDTSLTIKEIAIKYELDESMIYYINRGSYHTLSTEIYPLRKLQDFSKKNYYCIDCGKEISKGAKRCIQCDHKTQMKCIHPSREELKQLIRAKSFVEIGKIYQVSDKAVIKWCVKYNLPSRKKDIKMISDKDWQQI